MSFRSPGGMAPFSPELHPGVCVCGGGGIEIHPPDPINKTFSSFCWNACFFTVLLFLFGLLFFIFGSLRTLSCCCLQLLVVVLLLLLLFLIHCPPGFAYKRTSSSAAYVIVLVLLVLFLLVFLLTLPSLHLSRCFVCRWALVVFVAATTKRMTTYTSRLGMDLSTTSSLLSL